MRIALEGCYQNKEVYPLAGFLSSIAAIDKAI